MRFTFLFPILAVLALSACEIRPPDRYSTRTVTLANSAAPDDTETIAFSGDALLDFDLEKLVRVNFALERQYSALAIQLDQANHAANGFVISAALGIALGEQAKDAAELTARRILWALGVNEGIKYVNPAEMARAFRLAAQDSLCMAAKAALDGGAARAEAGDYATRIRLITAMRQSHLNLRTRLSRKRVGFITVFNNLREQERTLQNEDLIEATNDKMVAESAMDGDGFGADLYRCLK